MCVCVCWIHSLIFSNLSLAAGLLRSQLGAEIPVLQNAQCWATVSIVSTWMGGICTDSVVHSMLDCTNMQISESGPLTPRWPNDYPNMCAYVRCIRTWCAQMVLHPFLVCPTLLDSLDSTNHPSKTHQNNSCVNRWAAISYSIRI